MFSRIEETREMLERELGCDTFVEAYKTVQVGNHYLHIVSPVSNPLKNLLSSMKVMGSGVSMVQW